MLNFAGPFIPLVTPLTDDASSVSEVRVARLLRFLVGQNPSGFVLGTETGEFTTLLIAERKALLEIVSREAPGAPILVHASTGGTSGALDLAQHAERHGARAAILMPPTYGRFSDAELENHFRTVVHHCGIPIIALDPLNLMSAELREKLLDLPRMNFGTPLRATPHLTWEVERGLARSDEFALGAMFTSPLLQIPVEGGHRRALAETLVKYGRTRVAKAALEMLEIEVGSPRAPMLALSREGLDALRPLVLGTMAG